MTHSHSTTGKVQIAPPVGRANPTAVVYQRKLKAAERVASDILARLATTVREDPAAIADNHATMLPREIEDQQTYFLGKIAHIQETLKELGGLLPSSSREATVREQISIELMVLFVLIDCFRPERLRESGWNPDAGVEEVIRERVESLVLDVINIRERLK